jgi:exopolyphosphatase/pppGpp-phosphohydrolase
MPDTLGQRYAALRAHAAPATPLAVLNIGADQTHIAAGRGPAPDTVMVLDLGFRRTSATFFKHSPPTPGEIENAIQWVEDEIARARSVAASRPLLFTADAQVRQMARLAGAENATLTTPLVESLFDQLAARSQGRPASQTDFPDDAEFSAHLLILREFMHHLQFEAITALA